MFNSYMDLSEMEIYDGSGSLVIEATSYFIHPCQQFLKYRILFLRSTPKNSA